MTRRPAGRDPRIDPVDPQDLAPGDAGSVVAGARLDGLLLTNADLAGSDLAGLVLDECRVQAAVLDDARLAGWRVLDSVLDRVTGTAVRAAGAAFRDVLATGCRFGAAELFEAQWDRVHLDGCRIDLLSLADAHLTDVLLTDCVLGDLDLRGARIRRLALRDCRVGELLLAGSDVQDLDLRAADLAGIDDPAALRGARISGEQLALLAPLLAAALGIEVDD